MMITNLDIKKVFTGGMPVKTIYSKGVKVWPTDSHIWKFDPSGYLVGEDGKYYQRYYDDSEYEDNNPIPDLNDEWVEDTVSGDLNIDKNYDYFMSNSNYHKANGYSQFKVSWSGLNEITFLYRSKAESGYDYLVINGMDRPKFAFLPTDTTQGVIAHTKGKQSDTYSELKLECDEGEHFIWFCYRKDSSADTEPDRAFVGIPNNYKSGTLYEKQGDELSYSYIESTEAVYSRPGYIRFKYYKTYFTPDGSKQLRTDDYILGDEVPATPITRDYLRFVNTNSDDITLSVYDLNKFNGLKYSFGVEESFTDFTNTGITIPSGETVYLKASGMNNNTSKGFETSASCECHGNVMSLITEDFENCFTLDTKYCLSHLFEGTKITTAPELPATTLTDDCYEFMFRDCTALTTAPELPATTLTRYCYFCMFVRCSALVTAPELPATTLANDCYYDMFCGCTALTTAPVLPATTLRSGCYREMFSGCSSLNKITMFADTWSDQNYSTDAWVENVAPTGTFIKSPTGTLDNLYGRSHIPVGWNVEEYGEQGEWVRKYWNLNLNTFGAIWHDNDGHTYFSYSGNDYELVNGSWVEKSWNKYLLTGSSIWHDNDGHTYYSAKDYAYENSSQYELVNGSWIVKSWGSKYPDSGRSIWSDNGVCYYSKDDTQMVLGANGWEDCEYNSIVKSGYKVWHDNDGHTYYTDRDNGVSSTYLFSNGVWSPVTWGDIEPDDGSYIWTDNKGHIYYTYSHKNLELVDNHWVEKQWNDIFQNPEASLIWHDSEGNTYYSGDDTQLKLL